MADNDYRQELTNRIIEALEAGTAPWQKPWDGSVGSFFPLNPTTGKQYRGGNALWLMLQGYEDPRWCTFNQANEMGWKIRKGSKATYIEYWKWSDTVKEFDEEAGEEVDVTLRRERPTVFYAKVFNLSQMENVPELARVQPAWDALEMAEHALAKSEARIFHDQMDKAFYSPGLDEIHMPPRPAFPDASRYYSTALHELGHWTGHESRLGRNLGNGFGSPEYAKEELRAELASLFLSDRLGIPFDFEQHAAYVGSWIKALQEDKHEIFKAARDAEKIVTHVMDLALSKTVEIEKEVLQEKSMAKSRIYLHVPFAERGEAKALGARWDKDVKAWYAPSGKDIRNFSKWENPRDQRVALQEFESACREAGLLLDGPPVMDGKWHYVPVEGGRKKELQGSYKGTLDGSPNGYIKNLYDDSRSRGWKFQTVGVDAEKVAALERSARDHAAKRDAEDQAEKELIARSAAAYVHKLPDFNSTDQHAYLLKQKVPGYGLKKDGDLLVLPMQDINGKIWSYQTIKPEGEKKYKYGGKKTGCFHLIGELQSDKPVLIMEGYATGASAYLATGIPVAVAFDSGNLLEVARAIKQSGRAGEVHIGGDDDRFLRCTVGWSPKGKYFHSNPGVNEGALPNSGRVKAEEAAAAVGGKAIFPKFGSADFTGTDFNDLHKREGLRAVRDQLSLLLQKENVLIL
ncbi:zincin-like metallopeptidase domain-containing protein [Methylovorus glucosotrophus]|uniref:Toprim domain-containing protein n=1 Tax=Methylovorus glucosotrophus (strain SIP3-4) TaxID=582744 RepID=C6XEP9_METGS|nr:zincin-like metallopeptidase domain-containing protein [Methylovorus glucosotrophus]ACT52106.1 domain of unknown function DUF1738 [Methylovorus glucosotrophus SIP3-4]